MEIRWWETVRTWLWVLHLSSHFLHLSFLRLFSYAVSHTTLYLGGPPHLVYDWLPEKEQQWWHKCFLKSSEIFNYKRYSVLKPLIILVKLPQFPVPLRQLQIRCEHPHIQSVQSHPWLIVISIMSTWKVVCLFFVCVHNLVSTFCFSSSGYTNEHD